MMLPIDRMHDWRKLRKAIDDATSRSVEFAWFDSDAPTPAQVSSIARDMFEQWYSPTDEQWQKIATTLALIPSVNIAHDPQGNHKPATSYRVLDVMTRLEYWRLHPEFCSRDQGGGPLVGSRITTLDARDCEQVLILIGPLGGLSAMHIDHPEHATAACRIANGKRLWYTRPGPNVTDNWHRI